MGRSLVGQNLAGLVKVKGDVAQIFGVSRCLHHVHLMAVRLRYNRGIVAARPIRPRCVAAREQEGVRMATHNHVNVRATVGCNVEVNIQARVRQDDDYVHTVCL